MSTSAPEQPTLPNWRSQPWPWIAASLIPLVTALVLWLQGRLWWCECGSPALWSGNVVSSHNSQHLFDPYVFTHVLHGVLFCGLFAWLCPRWKVSWRFCLAILIEAGWEMLENTNLVIERYRTATASLDYFGDTVANSLGDIVGCGLGFWLARWIRLRGSLVFFAATELMLIVWIRDSLLLSVLMLIYPVEAIKNWQLKAQGTAATAHGACLLRNDLVGHVAVDVGEAEVAAGVAERELLVVEAQQVQHRGVQVVRVEDALDGGVAHRVGRAMTKAAFHAAACHPHGEAAVVVAAAAGVVFVRPATELAAPDEQRVFEEPALA